jgi:hypothetical protein
MPGLIGRVVIVGMPQGGAEAASGADVAPRGVADRCNVRRRGEELRCRRRHPLRIAVAGRQQRQPLQRGEAVRVQLDRHQHRAPAPPVAVSLRAPPRKVAPVRLAATLFDRMVHRHLRIAHGVASFPAKFSSLTETP